MGMDLTRREFIIAGGIATGIAVGGAAVADLSRGVGGIDADEDIETPSSAYGSEETMGKRVLVGYATRTGSTTGVAEAIGAQLAERGYAVDVKPLKERPAIAGYDAVVLGSAVNGGAWLPEAVKFAESNASALTSIPTALFSVHIMNLGNDEKATRRRTAYTTAVRAAVKPTAEAFFAGKGPDAVDTSLIARWAFKAFGGGGEGDCRDWAAISRWAQNVNLEQRAR